MNFLKKLDRILEKNNSLLCIGLDSDFVKLPKFVKKEKYPQFAFNKAIIDATHDLVCTYKPNSAFYEARGADGISELKMTCDYLKKRYPEIFLIIDAKRGDIGNTNEGYAVFAFDYLSADAITLQPYFGGEALKPFLDRKDKGCIILCRTSNPGAKELQDLNVNGEPLYKVIARKVASEWNRNGNCMLVVGATYPDDINEIRKIAGDIWFLVPGVGRQGGDLEKTVKAGLNSMGSGVIINASRSVIFSTNGSDFSKEARKKANDLRNKINKLRS